MCEKNYCPCFKEGRKCGFKCVCTECRNKAFVPEKMQFVFGEVSQFMNGTKRFWSDDDLTNFICGLSWEYPCQKMSQRSHSELARRSRHFYLGKTFHLTSFRLLSCGTLITGYIIIINNERIINFMQKQVYIWKKGLKEKEKWKKYFGWCSEPIVMERVEGSEFGWKKWEIFVLFKWLFLIENISFSIYILSYANVWMILISSEFMPNFLLWWWEKMIHVKNERLIFKWKMIQI